MSDNPKRTPAVDAFLAALDGTAAVASKPRPPIDVAALRSATAEATALALLAAGYHPTVLYPAEGDKEGKDPIGKGWGLGRPSVEDVRGRFRYKPSAGVGICMGPGKAPGGLWLVDCEGDGPEAEESLLRLLGGEEVETTGWTSARGSHRLFVVGDGFLDAIIAAGAVEGTGAAGKATYHLAELPGLEIRVGGWKSPGVVKQTHSACPPTARTDGKPREWFGPGHVAEMPDAAVAFLEALGERRAIKGEHEPPPRTIPINTQAFTATVPRDVDPIERYTRAGVEAELKTLAATGEGGRNDQLNKSAGRLGMFVAAGVLSEDEAVAGLLDACRSNGLGDTPEVRATIRSGLEYGKTRPRDLSHVGAKAKAQGRPWQPPPTEAEVDAVEVVDRWPKLDPNVFYGVAGRVVEMIDPYTESDKVATLVQFLAGFGNLINRSAFFRVTATTHHLKLNVVLVGETGEGRKGTSWDPVRYLLSLVDREWAAECIHSGLVSGEGLIHFVRDERWEEVKTKDRKTGVVQVELKCVDPGVTEKRMLAVESEMSRMLKAASRDSNTLTDVIRQAWESDYLRTLGKHHPSKATGAHVSIIAHSTREDIQRHLTETDQANGFSNRFLWVAVRRSKDLPDPGDVTEADWGPIVAEVDAAREFAAFNGPIKMTLAPDAQALWNRMYSTLRARVNAKHLNRAAAYVKRIAAIYAILDRSAMVWVEHLTAAYALWAYCQESVGYIFGDNRNPNEIKLLDALEKAPQGLTRWEITEKVFGKNLKASQIGAILETLLTRGDIHRQRLQHGGKGRPAERWFYGRESRP